MYLFPLNSYILDFGKDTFQKPFFQLCKCIITDSHLNNISSGTLWNWFFEFFKSGLNDFLGAQNPLHL